MQLKKGTELTVEIKYLNISGRGVAEVTLNDQPYFLAVDDLYPGDVAKVSLTRIKKKYLEAKLIELVTPSTHRTKPRSKHADISGGSPWEVLDYDYQLEIKQNEVERIFENVGEDKSKILPIVGMEDPWFYRNKMQYSFGYDAEMYPTLGLHVKGRRFDVYDVDECLLCEEWIPEILEFWRTELFRLGLGPYKFQTGEGDLRELTIKVGKNTGEIIVILSITNQADKKLLRKPFENFIEQFPAVTSIYLETVTVRKGHRTTFHLKKIHGEDQIQELVGDKTFLIGPHTFFQPNTTQATKIFETVKKFAGQDTGTVYDLFCGSGTIGIMLSDAAKEVYGIDLVKESITNANQNAELNNCPNCHFEVGDVFKELAKLNWPKPDLVVVDPPRAGLSPELIEFVASLQPAKIIYVSCNIKSFTRDLQDFKTHGWLLTKTQPVDQFPHTRHMELVSVLELGS